VPTCPRCDLPYETGHKCQYREYICFVSGSADPTTVFARDNREAATLFVEQLDSNYRMATNGAFVHVTVDHGGGPVPYSVFCDMVPTYTARYICNPGPQES
jgi:hypothetical protein